MNNKYSIIALLGICLLTITTYFYLFKFYDTLFWFYQLDPRFIVIDSFDNPNIDAIYEAHRKIIPAKKPYFFIQFAQVIILFTYCYIYSRPKSIGGIIYSKNHPQITRGQEVKPINRAILYIAGVFLILYIVIFLIGSIAPYGMLG